MSSTVNLGNEGWERLVRVKSSSRDDLAMLREHLQVTETRLTIAAHATAAAIASAIRCLESHICAELDRARASKRPCAAVALVGIASCTMSA